MTKRPLLLAIDTATALGVALFDGSVIGELVQHSEQNQTRELLPAILWLLGQQDLTTDDVGAIAISLGPGSFNGLRVGISTAKALAFARAIPCLGIPTLEATAYQHVAGAELIRPLYDAGRGEVTTALYRSEDGVLRSLEEPRLTTIQALAGEIDRPTLVCGELRATCIEELRRRLGDIVSFPPAAGLLRRPGFLAELGWRRFTAGERDDVVSMQPIYLRRPAITMPKAH